MYVIRDSEGKFVSAARSRVTAHRATRMANRVGASVSNRPGVGKGMSKTDMVVVMYGDQSLYGAAVENERTTSPSYWGYDRGEPVALFRASVPHEIVGFSDFEKTKPVTLVEALEGQGTTEQWFEDGYKGWRAVAPYVKPKKPFYVSHEYDKDFGPFKRESDADEGQDQ